MEQRDSIKEKVDAARAFLSKEPGGAAWVAMMDIGRFVNISAISRRYFGKSDNWLLQRLRGYRVNGKPASLKPEEMRQLAAALDDMAGRLHASAERLRTAAPIEETAVRE